ncbi:hypothetical protein SFA35_12650 [Pseudomonas sp. HR96]|uniref:hypothetical protein n=1 Tax=Pseudomonas sp. HR96 TaxID=1027966 RepID=UPI002A7611EE|nr:hypothetical protein [Pseudomonas sp. HR96]WPO97527.1 hypothetical protein SFA35_12650 [Pseudomonas sp. HR96]
MASAASPIKQSCHGLAHEDSGAAREVVFNRLPSAIDRALVAVSPEGVTGYLLCALEHKRRVSGLLFCDQNGDRQDGSPIQTGVIEDRAWVEEYELIIATDGVYVVAHRSHENGATEPVICWH